MKLLKTKHIINNTVIIGNNTNTIQIQIQTQYKYNIMKRLNNKDFVTFCEFLSHHLEVDLNDIQIKYEFLSVTGEYLQLLLIKSRQKEKIQEIIDNDLFIPFGILYSHTLFRRENEYNCEIELVDEIDCLLKIEKIQEHQHLNDNLLERDLMGIQHYYDELNSLENEINELMSCKENNYWTSYYNENLVLK